MPPAPFALSAKARRTPEQPISHFMRQALENPGLISLAAGFVDEPSFPVAEVAEACVDLFVRPETARAALQYGTTAGYLPLRQKLAARLAAADGVTLADSGFTAEEVVVTTGSQQMLSLTSELLLDTGDLVITEAPSYFVFHGTLAGLGVEVLAVPMDEEGMRTDLLERLLTELERDGRLARLKLIYTVDYFQNPSGRSLSLPRRKHLMELVRRFSTRHRILVLEDAAYRELRYDGDDLPSLKRFDPGNEYVIYTSTFSKPLAPGLKTGYGVMPRELVGPLLRLKGGQDFGSGNLTQHVIDRLLATGAYDRHLGKLRAAYRRKRDVMLEALTQAFREWPAVRWERPAGGLYVWLRLPSNVKTGPGSPLSEAALREGVLYVPGEFCHVADGEESPDHEARLCFGVATPEQIREGVRRLARAAKTLDQLQYHGKRAALTV